MQTTITYFTLTCTEDLHTFFTDMYLITAATEFEMRPFRAACPPWATHLELITGVGLLETAVRLTEYLVMESAAVTGVINFGVAGAYEAERPKGSPALLDICLAREEVVGDLGICLDGRIEALDEDVLPVKGHFFLDMDLLARAKTIFAGQGISFHSGTFVTVNCATGTTARGRLLRDTHGGLCENMEGAAVARVCNHFALPCLELRCVSNMVEDRDLGRWRLRRACERAGKITALLFRELFKAREQQEGSR